ncbi:ribulose-phosphate 3-epimerase [Candidatus Acetothermia bacterium]|nr:ribulose-phosphate 3-epimerase [Candidatus Acetothermia bacterium]
MKLALSLLSADFGKLRAEAIEVESQVDYFHIDVMDGHFVPNLTIGPPVVNSLRRGLSRPLDIHLMIDHPVTYAPQFDVYADDFITFHIEAQDDPDKVIDIIAATGAGVGISLRPATPISTLRPYLNQVDLVLVMTVEPGFGNQQIVDNATERIAELSSLISKDSSNAVIAVDGGVNKNNINSLVRAGAEMIVVGSAIFSAPNRRAAIEELIAVV